MVNKLPHLPTLVWALIGVVVVVGGYHLLVNRDR